MVERFSERNLWPGCVIFVKIPLPPFLDNVEYEKKNDQK